VHTQYIGSRIFITTKEGRKMTAAELDDFLAKHQNIECRRDSECNYFRNRDLAWYAHDAANCTRISKELCEKLTADELLYHINRGLDVEQITRITGYFTKVSQWNKGKRGELKDRVRTSSM
jgi:hypothetical protein